MNKVHLIDCMKLMKTTPDKHYELAIVDPPYGLGKRVTTGAGKLKNRFANKSETPWDIAPTQEYFDELFRISRHQVIWGGNYFDLPPTRCILCWDKVQAWENFSQFELAWTSFDAPAQIFKYSTTQVSRESVKIHPTQKPIKLYQWVLSKYAKQGYKIFDSHVGSGSIRIACYDLGLDFEGCEIDPTYWQAQEDRFQEHISQGLLFETTEMVGTALMAGEAERR